MLRGLWDALTFRPAPGESLDRRTLFRHLSSERYWEWRLGLKTRGHIKPDSLSRLLGRQQAYEYGPVPFRAFWTMMESVPPEHRRGDFVDFGSGKGRALLLARSYGFRRLIGVEPIEVLRRIAEENIRRAGADNIELVAADAADFEVPAEASVYFFYNPFGKDRFEPVLRNIRKSHHSHPRPASILALNSEDFLSLARDCAWLVPKQTGMAVPDMRWDRFEVGEA
jgi:SAM-dependent methyltransferase